MQKIDIEGRLKELGIVIPDMPLPIANYVSAKRTGNLVLLPGKYVVWVIRLSRASWVKTLT